MGEVTIMIQGVCDEYKPRKHSVHRLQDGWRTVGQAGLYVVACIVVAAVPAGSWKSGIVRSSVDGGPSASIFLRPRSVCEYAQGV